MIKLVNLNKAYRDKIVLKNLNLEINKGEIIGLLAPNAEGKSTLLKILGGQITFDSGQYFFNGEEFNYKDKEVIGYMNDTAMIPKKWKVINEEKKPKPIVEVKKEVKEKKNNEKVINTLNKIEDNRKGIILFVIGFLIATLLFRCILFIIKYTKRI